MIVLMGGTGRKVAKKEEPLLQTKEMELRVSLRQLLTPNRKRQAATMVRRNRRLYLRIVWLR